MWGLGHRECRERLRREQERAASAREMAHHYAEELRRVKAELKAARLTLARLDEAYQLAIRRRGCCQ